MTERGRGRPDAPGHRGGPRRDGRRPEGQEGPDDRARPGRRPRRRRTATADEPVLAALAPLEPGLRAVTIYYGDGRRPRRGRGPRPAHRGGGARASRSRSSTAASRTTGTSSRRSERRRRPAPPASRRARPPVAAGRRPRRLARPRSAQSGLTRRRAVAPGRPAAGHRDGPRPAVPPARAATTTCASCATPRRAARASRTATVVSARVDGPRPRVEQTFRRRVQRTIADLGGRDRRGARRSGSAGASSSGGSPRATRLVVSGKVKRPRLGGRLRRPGVPARRTARRPAPRRADRAVYRLTAGLTAARLRARDARGARPGRARLPRVPAGRDPRAARACRPIGRGASRPPTTRTTFEARDAALRRLAFDELLALQLGHGRPAARSAAGASAPPLAVDDARRRPRSGRPLDGRRSRASSAATVELTADQAARDRRDPRRDLAPARADAAPAPGRRRLGQDGRRGLRAGAACAGAGRQGGAARADRPARPPARARPSATCSSRSGMPVTLLTGSLQRGRDAGNALEAIADRPGAASSSGPTPCSRSRSRSRDLGLAVVDEQHRFGVAQRGRSRRRRRRRAARAADDRDADPADAGPGPLRRPRRLRPAHAARRAGVRDPDRDPPSATDLRRHVGSASASRGRRPATGRSSSCPLRARRTTTDGRGDGRRVGARPRREAELARLPACSRRSGSGSSTAG